MENLTAPRNAWKLGIHTIQSVYHNQTPSSKQIQKYVEDKLQKMLAGSICRSKITMLKWHNQNLLTCNSILY
jgi:hypothetical protein